MELVPASHARHLICKPILSGLAAIATLVAGMQQACIQEIAPADNSEPVIYIDGALLIGEPVQTLDIGRATDPLEPYRPIATATPRVTDLATGEHYDYVYDGEGHYSAAFEPVFDRAYQLTFELPGEGRYVTLADSLPPSPIVISGRATLQEVREQDGSVSNVARGRVSGEVTVSRSGTEPSTGALVAAPYLIWSYADRSCGFNEGVRICFFEDRPGFEPIGVADLSALTNEGDTLRLRVGSYSLDARFSLESFIGLESRRYATPALEYFGAVQSALEVQSGSRAPSPTVPFPSPGTCPPWTRAAGY